MIEHIIVPVDFSATSQNAYLYARELAGHFAAKITVVHAYIGISSTDEVYVDSVRLSKTTLQKQLDDFVKLYPTDSRDENLPDIPVTTRLIDGFAVKSIVELSADESTSLIVMGSTGESDVTDRMIGSVSSEVAQQSYCPVFLVPKGVKYFDYKNILYASNYESADELILEHVLKFNQYFSAALHFVHVSRTGESSEYDITEKQIFEKIFNDGPPTYSFNLSLEKSGSVLNGLFQYSEENNIDLIVLVNRQRGFFESLLGQSMTKKVALRSKTPLLIYHIPA